MLESAVAGLMAALAWPAIGYLLLGIVLGIYFGAVPGLSGLTGMAILLPFTFGMEPVSAFSFLLGMYAVTTTSDSIPAILIGVPGTAAAQATVLDGFPMSQRGEATRAFGAAFTCSAIGGVLGGIVMGLSIPLVQPIVLSFAQPEFFMLGLLGLTMVGALSGNSITKGMAGAGLGLLLSQIGYSEQGAIPRYWMGFTYLLDGLSLVPVVLGLFAVPELVSLAVSNRAISSLPPQAAKGGIRAGFMDSMRNWWLLLRSSLIGIYIGMLPALGSTIADWVAYGHAVQSAKDKSQFGKGDVRGVIAPEAANNSCKGGELVPTVAFGIPGSAPMAILLGAFLVQGLTPGPEMLTTKLALTYSLMWSLILANIIAAVVLLAWANQLQRIIFVPAHLVVPGVAFFVLIGAWTASSNIGDWISLIVFGIVGTLMKEAGWPRAPMVLGFILGRIMESSLHLSISSYGMSWITRPICIVLAIIILTTLILAVRSQMGAGRSGQQQKTQSEGDEGNVKASMLVGLGAIAVLGYGVITALGWPRNVAMFPLAFGVPALALVAFAFLGDTFALVRRRGLPATAAAGGGEAGADPAPAAKVGAIDRAPATPAAGHLLRTALFLSWLAGISVATVLVGQHAAIAIFVFAYLLAWGRYSFMVSLAYTACVMGVMVVVFDILSPTTWYPALLPQWLGW